MPDVGALHHLARLPGEVGTLLGLTGARLRGSAVLAAGLATHFCHSSRLPKLLAELAGLGAGETLGAELTRLLDHYQTLSLTPDQQVLKSLNLRRTVFLLTGGGGGEGGRAGGPGGGGVQRVQPGCYAGAAGGRGGAVGGPAAEPPCPRLSCLASRNSQVGSNSAVLPTAVRCRLLRELEASGCDFDTALVRSYAVAGNLYFHGQVNSAVLRQSHLAILQMRTGIETALCRRGRSDPAWPLRSIEQVVKIVPPTELKCVAGRCRTPWWTTSSPTSSGSSSSAWPRCGWLTPHSLTDCYHAY